MTLAQRAARFIFFAFGFAISSWAPMIPFAKDRLDIDDAQLGFILLFSGVGALVTMPFAGWLIHRLGSRWMTIVSGLFVGALLPFLALAPTSVTLSCVLFLFGGAAGAFNVSINAQAIEIEAKSAASIMSGLHCLFSTGGLLGALAVSALLELDLSLPFCGSVVTFIVVSILGFQGGHLLQPEPTQDSIAPQRRFAFPGFNVIILGMMCFIAFMSEGSMLDWSAEFLRSSFGYNPAVAGIGYALFSISMAFGRLIGDRLIERFGMMVVFQFGSFLAASGFAILVYPAFYYGELIGFCMIGLGASNIVPIL